jgi:cardiolipin synthase
MDTFDILASSFRSLITVMRAAGISKAAAMSDADVVGNAYSLANAILATSWQRRMGAPSWQDVYTEWQRQVSDHPGIESALYGCFGPNERFELLTSNKAAFEKRHELYANAQRTIDLATYYIQADETGRRTALALADCARRGVRVRVVADKMITGRKTRENPSMEDISRLLKGAGVDYRLFLDPRRPWDACHRKMLIVDGETLVTGGRNYANHYSGDKWRDIDLLLTGPSIARLQPYFEETFRGDAVACCNGVGIFQPACPADLEHNTSFIYLLQCIREARETLDIENAYFFSHAPVISALSDASRRGVRVRVFTNSAQSNDLDFINYRLYRGFPDLLDAGASLFLRRGKDCTVHCKYFVADGEWVGFGSSNLDFFSPRFCLELGLHVRHRRLGQMLTEWFEKGIAESDPLTDAASARKFADSETAGRAFDRWLPDFQ